MTPIMSSPSEREAQAIHLAHVTARRMHRGDLSHVLREDVEGAALLGAARALAQWRPGRGTEFRSYAIKLIQCEIHEERRRWDWLKRRERSEAKRIHAETGTWPRWAGEPLSLEELREPRPDQVDEEWIVAFVGIAADPDMDTEAQALARLAAWEWRRLVDQLPEEDRRLVTAHYWDEVPLAIVSRALGYSREWARMRCPRALARLRAWAEAAGLSG
jgi:RNA polymerase sigma factor (sigma-70 family)